MKDRYHSGVVTATFPKAVAITVNWKSSTNTIDCVESLLAQDYRDLRIFFLDNGSGDGSAEQLEKWGRQRLGDAFLTVRTDETLCRSFHHKAVLFKSEENLGFAGGNNFACRQALRAGAQYVWFINNDTVQDRDALSALIGVAESDEAVGMVCSKVLYFDRPDTIESMGASLLVPLGIFRHIRQGEKDVQQAVPEEVPYIYGCSFLVRAKVCEDVGLLDERYFLLIEESDWSLRARRKGWKLYSAPASRIRHKGTVSIGKRSETFFYYVTRNTLLFMKEHYPLFLPTAALFMLPLASGLAVADGLSSAGKFHPEKLRAILRGYLHFIKGRFGRLSP